jgi:hypothetical protein
MSGVLRSVSGQQILRLGAKSMRTHTIMGLGRNGCFSIVHYVLIVKGKGWRRISVSCHVARYRNWKLIGRRRYVWFQLLRFARRIARPLSKLTVLAIVLQCPLLPTMQRSHQEPGFSAPSGSARTCCQSTGSQLVRRRVGSLVRPGQSSLAEYRPHHFGWKYVKETPCSLSEMKIRIRASGLK